MDQLDSLDSENQLRKLTSFQSYTSRSVNLIRKELESYLEKDEELATENDLDGSKKYHTLGWTKSTKKLKKKGEQHGRLALA